MFALFEEGGKFQTGRVMSAAEASTQVELPSGKRVKVKAANVLLGFAAPQPEVLMAEAHSLAADIDLNLAWEFAPEGEFAFADLAAEYYSDKPTLPQQVAALLALFEAPHYFRRAGKGRFKKAPAEIVQQALAAIEKKKQIQAQIDAWVAELAAGRCPEPVQAQLFKILFKPDKNAPEYKAVAEAARVTQLAPLTLLQRAGAIASPYQFHWQRFLFEHFPKGTGFPAGLQAPPITAELPLASVRAVSIDDSHTTEIDDALSVQDLGTDAVTVGIHIAAPGLALHKGDAVDAVARQRLSTVYMPGHKITMLPDDMVQQYTLAEGRDCPALSLYVTYNAQDFSVTHTETKLERVPIVTNLRHDQLDDVVTEAWLAADAPSGDSVAAPWHAELAFLHRLAQHLKAAREVVRGKPETFNRPDYSFKLEPKPDGVPTGEERVLITERRRGAPLDLIVSELMIVANSTWGQWLAQLGLPGIYRSQVSLAPGVKVRMSTKALPHAGIGVPSYAWSTSPLRRYVDLVNQWQLIAAAQHGNTAALVAPFKPKDAELFSVISAFDAAYSAYNAHQAGMERLWTLKYLQQHGITELDVTLLRPLPGGLWAARATTLPLVLNVFGAQHLPRGEWVRVALGEVDEIALDVGARFVAELDAPTHDGDGNDADLAEEDGDDDAVAGPLTIVLESGDDAAAAAASPAASA